MTASLAPDLEDLIRRKVGTGRYASAGEVVREALRLMEERDRIWDAQKPEIRKQIASGMESLRAGQGTDGDAFFAGLEAEFEEFERRESR